MEQTQTQNQTPQPIIPPTPPAKSGKALAIILSIIITFIVVAGGAYAWQAYFIAPEKEQLQEQVGALTSQTEFLQQQIQDLQGDDGEEEDTTDNMIDVIKNLFMTKYNLSSDYIDLLNVSISEETANHIRGLIILTEQNEEGYEGMPGLTEGGAIFFAAKVNNHWILVFDGLSAFNCALLEQYDFPTSMKSGCIGIVETESTPEILDLKNLFVTKYNLDISDVSLSISQETANHVRGMVGLPAGGGIFLAAKVNSDWTLVHDGNGAIMCGVVTPYNFPVDMISDCVQ